MIRVRDHQEYDVWCNDCRKVISFDSPEDITKGSKQNSAFNPMYCLVCPNCGKEIWFNGITGFTLPREFTRKVKEREFNYPSVITTNGDEDILIVVQSYLDNMQKSFEEFDW